MAMALANLTHITVTGTYVTTAGQPAVGRVRFRPSHVLTDPASNENIYPTDRVATLDATGSFSVSLPATDDPDITPTGWVYWVTELVSGPNGEDVQARRPTYALSLPHDGPSVDLADVAPVSSAEAAGLGTAFASQADFVTHRDNVSNPHSVTAAQAGAAPTPHTLGGSHHGADTLANLNTKVSDATLDDSSASRTPKAHALGGAAHSADTLAALNALVSDGTLSDFQANTRANQPAAGVVNRYFYVTDEKVLERDNGTAWQQIVDLAHRNTAGDAHGLVDETSMAAGDLVRVKSLAPLLLERLDPGTYHPANSPTARVELSTSPSIADSTNTVISWEIEVFDNAGMWVSTAPNRLTAPEDGIYIALIALTWVASGTGHRLAQTRVNGTAWQAATRIMAVSDGEITQEMAFTLVTLVAGDYVEGVCRQQSGGALGLHANSGTFMGLQKLGEL